MSGKLRWAWVSIACLGCTPEFDDQPSLITEPRIVGVVVEPPEARPRAPVSLTPIFAPKRPRATLSYHFCDEPPTLADPRPVSDTCVGGAGIPLSADRSAARGSIPTDACARFGPDPVGSDFQPRDADATGGFYQPYAISGLGPTTVGLVRIVCPLPDVAVDLARELQEQYVPNQNPSLVAIERQLDGAWTAAVTARPGEHVALRVRWDDAAREPYVWLPPDGTRLESRRESLQIAWFSSAGAFEQATTGRAESDPASESDNLFTAPDAPGSVSIWVVARDSRGGSAWLTSELTIE